MGLSPTLMLQKTKVSFRLAVPSQAVRAHANIESEQGTSSCPVRISKSSSNGDNQAVRVNGGQLWSVRRHLSKFVS